MTLQRILSFAFAVLALYFAYCIAMEFFIAWYSGVEPELSAAHRVWLVAGFAALLFAAGFVLWSFGKS